MQGEIIDQVDKDPDETQKENCPSLSEKDSSIETSSTTKKFKRKLFLMKKTSKKMVVSMKLY